MRTRNVMLGSCLAVVSMGAVVAQVDVSARRHPNIAAAQRFTDQAIQRIDAAQQANEFDMNGHAQKAKDLLFQANEELKQAAMTANHK